MSCLCGGDEARQLRKENERLQRQVSDYEFWIAAWPIDVKPEDYDRLQQENERLRRIEEAMEKIANGNHGGHAKSFARETLEKE